MQEADKPTIHFRKVPLPWSRFFKLSTDFPDQRTSSFTRFRVVGYIDLSNNKSSPIWEIEKGDQCVHLHPDHPRGRLGRFLDIESRLERFFIFNTFQPDDPKFCKFCSAIHFFSQNSCPSCSINCADYVIPYNRLRLPGSSLHSVRYKLFPWELKEELMMKACHPARKNLFQSICSIDELD